MYAPARPHPPPTMQTHWYSTPSSHGVVSSSLHGTDPRPERLEAPARWRLMGAPVRPQRVGAPPPPVKAHGHLPLLSQNPSKSDAEASGLRHAAGPLQVHRSGGTWTSPPRPREQRWCSVVCDGGELDLHLRWWWLLRPPSGGCGSSPASPLSTTRDGRRGGGSWVIAGLGWIF